MHVAYGKIFTDATTEQKAWKVFRRFQQQLGRETGQHELETYQKGGFVIGFEVDIPETDWNAAVVNTLALVQRVGRSWIITGDINSELDGWSDDPQIAGVTDIHIILEA